MIAPPSIPGAAYPRVLLADDHLAMLALTADALADECFVVGSVGDGREFLAEAERLHPDVIVLDITMPRLDGIEAARQLRRSQRPARLVFLTSTKTPTMPAPRSMRARSAMSSRRSLRPTFSLPFGQRSPNMA